ncbi:MAG: hypothetical protein IPI67_30865 [Myxococcales bacterium]|nr:hypothetical protein [Myxococcales bacterium]
MTAAATPTRAAPFGPGATVEVTSEGLAVNVFVARMSPTAVEAPADSAFIKLGKTPLAFELPPGTFRIEVEGVDIGNEAMLLEMRGDPRRLKVKTGSEGLGTTGTLLMAVGILGWRVRRQSSFRVAGRRASWTRRRCSSRCTPRVRCVSAAGWP